MLKIELTNTSAGLTAIQRAIAGDDITFTKLVIGDGVITNPDISNLTNVVNEIKHFPLGVVKPEDEEMLRVRSNINNVGLTEDKIIREYGLFAKFGSEQEFLFAYLNSGESTTPLPKASGGRYDLNRDFVLYAGNSNNVVFDANGDLVYATLNDIKAMDAKKENVITRTDTPEQDSQKVFSALGAFNLKNWLVTNYTTLMNNIRETLENAISTKLPHGGYSGTGKALFDLIKSNLSKLENLQNTKEDKITRTHVPENDPNKVFTGKGALDLKNWLVTAYTNAINTVRDTLQTSINTKLAHGGYSGTAQALLNLINGKINKSDISSSVSSTSTSTVANSYAVKVAYDKGIEAVNKVNSKWDNNNCPASKSTNGYQKLANGIIIQWAEVSESTGGTSYKTFPIAFPNKCLSITLQLNHKTPGGLGINAGTIVQHVDRTKFIWTAGGTYGGGGIANIIAVGY